MAIYVFRRETSKSAGVLTEALGARRWKNRRWPIEEQVRPGDVVICWGDSLAPIEGVSVLNGAPLQDKIADALRLKEAGVPTITISFEPPTDPIKALYESLTGDLNEFLEVEPSRLLVYQQGVEALYKKFEAFHAELLKTPLEQSEWLPRMRHHFGGNDLLNSPARPDYWSKKEQIAREIRVHSFLGKSIRAGVKIPREGYAHPNEPNEDATLAHPWIRSHEAGYRVSYDGQAVRQAHRDLAHAAVKALNLQFGAVDIGERPDGSCFVLEVNRAPGIEAGTIAVYAKAIEGWQGLV